MLGSLAASAWRQLGALNSARSNAPATTGLAGERVSLGPVVAIAAGLLILAIGFNREVTAAVSVWKSSTAYGHCFLVLPIALYLAWERRYRILATPVVPLATASLLALPLATAWFAADRLGLMEGRQLVLFCFVQVLFLAVLGRRMWRTLSAPLVYLIFLVPFGAFATPLLQSFTARFIAIGLTVLGIPNYVDDFQIEIPEGNFYVAEACAGLRFLIASVAFGTLYAFLIYRSLRRRAAFIAVSILIPVVANGFRALGIVVLGHLLGSAEAAATDHVLYGWIFFSIVTLILIAAGLPFRQDTVPETPSAERTGAPATKGAAVGALAIAVSAALMSAMGPAAAVMLDRAAADAPALVWPNLALPGTCVADAPIPSHPAGGPRGTTGMSQRVTCGAAELTVAIWAIPPRANPGLFIPLLDQTTEANVSEDATTSNVTVPAGSPRTWLLTETRDPSRLTASLFWIDGEATQAGLTARARQALSSILGARSAPLLFAVGVPLDADAALASARADGLAAITDYLTAQTSLDAEMARLSAP
jgi:exosortase A